MLVDRVIAGVVWLGCLEQSRPSSACPQFKRWRASRLIVCEGWTEGSTSRARAARALVLCEDTASRIRLRVGSGSSRHVMAKSDRFWSGLRRRAEAS